MNKTKRVEAINALESNLSIIYPTIPIIDLDAVRKVASKVATMHYEQRPLKNLNVRVAMDGNNPILIVMEKDGDCVGLLNLDGDDKDEKMAEAMVYALREFGMSVDTL